MVFPLGARLRQLGSLGEFQDRKIHHEVTKDTKKSNMIQRAVCPPPDVGPLFKTGRATSRAPRALPQHETIVASLRQHDSIVLCALLRDLRAFVVDLLIS